MLERFSNWWKQPYHDNMTATQWAFFVLFMIIISWLWTRVLKTIAENLEG